MCGSAPTGSWWCTTTPTVATMAPIASLAASDLPAYVPMLAAAVDACGPELVVNMELKDLPGEPGYDGHHLLARLVARFVVDHGLVARVVISSFDLSALDAALGTDPARWSRDG